MGNTRLFLSPISPLTSSRTNSSLDELRVAVRQTKTRTLHKGRHRTQKVQTFPTSHEESWAVLMRSPSPVSTHPTEGAMLFIPFPSSCLDLLVITVQSRHKGITCAQTRAHHHCWEPVGFISLWAVGSVSNLHLTCSVPTARWRSQTSALTVKTTPSFLTFSNHLPWRTHFLCFTFFCLFVFSLHCTDHLWNK